MFLIAKKIKGSKNEKFKIRPQENGSANKHQSGLGYKPRHIVKHACWGCWNLKSAGLSFWHTLRTTKHRCKLTIIICKYHQNYHLRDKACTPYFKNWNMSIWTAVRRTRKLHFPGPCRFIMFLKVWMSVIDAPLWKSFAGVWRGRGNGVYPSIKPFQYEEELKLSDVDKVKSFNSLVDSLAFFSVLSKY